MSHSQFHSIDCLYLDMHGLIFETSVWLLAGSTRLLVHWNSGAARHLRASLRLNWARVCPHTRTTICAFQSCVTRTTKVDSGFYTTRGYRGPRRCTTPMRVWARGRQVEFLIPSSLLVSFPRCWSTSANSANSGFDLEYGTYQRRRDLRRHTFGAGSDMNSQPEHNKKMLRWSSPIWSPANVLRYTNAQRVSIQIFTRHLAPYI